MTCIQVILPLKLEWIPCYYTTEETAPGQIVRVAFSGKEYLGVVLRSNVTPELSSDRIQEVIKIEKDLPQISPNELKLWEFISTYYLCTLGEVFKAAYPSGKLHSEQIGASILERLKDKLARTEEKLKTRHCDSVRLRLEAEKEETLRQISLMEKQAATPARTVKAGKPVLLQGSQLTKIYIDRIKETLEKGLQVLVMCPETSFCERMYKELEEEFTGNIHLVHAEQTAAKKRAAAESLRRGEATIVIGARSAIFLTFSNLGLVIIDNEQDVSYKQSEPAPRYNGRDCAIFLAGLHSAQVILGSSCPSLESLHNCMCGKFETEHIAGGSAEPEVIDVSAEKRKNGMVGVFSRKALASIAAHEGEIVLLRGWEKEEELREAATSLLNGKEFSITRLPELKRTGCREDALILVMQADALVSRDDFRSDERALQLVALLQQMCSKLIIQTAIPQRFDRHRDASTLLEERKAFGFPPFKRLIDKKRRGSNELMERHFLDRSPELTSHKAQLVKTLEPYCYLDVDPQ